MFKTEITINMPNQTKSEYKHQSLMDKVADYITVCESDEDSYYHWQYLKCLYKLLSNKDKLSDTQAGILQVLEDFIMKHDRVSGEEPALDAMDMFKWQQD